jgi:hypothetical protein
MLTAFWLSAVSYQLSAVSFGYGLKPCFLIFLAAAPATIFFSFSYKLTAES